MPSTSPSKKQCSRCHEEKALSAFGIERRRPDGRKPYCKPCMRIVQKGHYNSVARVTAAKRWRANNLERARATAAIRTRKMREMVIAGYSGACGCCGETETEFLCVDHPDGNGGAERKLGLHSRKLYKKLIDGNFPEGYRILCANCNMATRLSKACPHTTAKTL